MFEGLLSGQEKPSGVDALLKLMEKDDIELKTVLEMLQIKTLVKTRYFYLRKKHIDKPALECLVEALDYYAELKISYKGKGRDDVVKGVTDMRQMLQQEQLIKANPAHKV